MPSKYAEDIRYMKEEIKEHNKLFTKQGKLLSRIDERTGIIFNKVNSFEKEYVTHREFSPYQKLIWLIVGAILTGAISMYIFVTQTGILG